MKGPIMQDRLCGVALEDALRATLNLLRNSAKSRRMTSGETLLPAAVDMFMPAPAPLICRGKCRAIPARAAAGSPRPDGQKHDATTRWGQVA